MFQLSKHNTLLSPLVGKTDSFVKRIFGFSIKDQRIDKDEVLVSFDVESLFNILLVEVSMTQCPSSIHYWRMITP